MGVKSVCVIGGGASGLCISRLLAAQPDMFEVVGFDRAAKSGGVWAYTDRVGIDVDGLAVHTSMYQNVKTNTPRCMTDFEGFPYKRAQPSFLGHEEVQEYLELFAEHYKLDRLFKFQTLVTKVHPLAPGSQDTRWEVTYCSTADQTKMEVIEFDYVIVCNGHLSVPFIPEVPGIQDFAGTVLHAHDYRVPDRFKGQKVVIFGGGPSAMDFAFDLHGVAEKITISTVEGSYLTFGAPEGVLRKPGIDHMTATSVVFTNGDEETADVIFFCTGYKYSFPFLSDACNVVVEDNGRRVTPLYKHTFHTEHPTLLFIGIVDYCASFCLFEHMAKFAVNIMSGKANLPSRNEMDADTTATLEKWMESGMARRNFHKVGGTKFELTDSMSAVGGVPLFPEGMRKLFFENLKQLSASVAGYREINYELDGDSFNVV